MTSCPDGVLQSGLESRPNKRNALRRHVVTGIGMKIVIAPDSYKESLSASEVAQAIEKDFGKFFLMHSTFLFRLPTVAKERWKR